MMRLRTFLISIAAAAFVALIFTTTKSASAQTLDTFSVLAATTVTNTGATTIDGNLGLSPGLATAITGFPPGIIGGTIYTGSDDSNTVAEDAQVALTTLYNTQAAKPVTQTLTGQTLGQDVTVLLPGVYFYSSSAQLTGALTLNAQGDPNAVFVIQIGSTLTTASNSSVTLINGAQGKNVYWVVGSSATLGTGTTFAGQILAVASITLTTGVTIDCGAALAQNGAVTLDTDVITTLCAFQGFGSPLGPTPTSNEQSVATALDTFVTNGGTLPAAFQDLLNGLSPADLATALTQLSGEAATGTAPAATQGMNSFMSDVFDSAFADSRSSPTETAPGPATVKTLGYASEKTPSPGPAAALAPLNASLDPNRWGVWASGYGGYSNTAGDISVGSHDRSATTFGVAAGFDRGVTAATTLGVAFGAGRTTFGLADNLGGGNDSMLQAALYSRTNFGAAYFAGALAYAYNALSTARDMTVPVPDHFTAAFFGQDVAGEIEAGYRLAWFIPYAAVRAQAFYTPAYSETAAPGPSPFALNYAAETTTALRTELGIRIERTIAIANGATLSLRARAAWAHDYGASPRMTAAFQSIPDASFTVVGAAGDSDSVLLSAGAEIGFRNGFALAGLFDSEIAENSQTYSGTGRVSYRW